MALTLTRQIERIDRTDRAHFQENYMRPQRPVIIRHFYGEKAPLYSKWTFDYFKENLYDVEVGVFDGENSANIEDRSYKGAPEKMKFGEYLELIQREPTRKRLFLFNVFKHQKSLFDDFAFPDVADHVLKFLPFAFFGGAGAVTRIHRDMDNSNVFLTELAGRKRVVLFHPKYSKLLYRYPFGTHTSIDINDPDYDRFPGLKFVQGYETILEPGDTLFMPAGWWHHIEYMTPGLGFSIRSLSPYISDRMRGLYQVGLLTHLDEVFRYMLGARWFSIKKSITQRRANRAMAVIEH